MARTFENPSNGHREEVDGGASCGAFFLGMIYLLYKGLWGHVFIWFLLVVLTSAASGAPLFVFTLPIASIAYALTIQGILSNRYLSRGWRELHGAATSLLGESLAKPSGQPQPVPPRVLGTPDSVFSATSSKLETMPPAKPLTKICPFCAEEVKFDAIKCKHCQSDLTGAM